MLIAGESGTGKEVLARFIHRHSPRADTAFIAVNCAAIPENMLEAMLFGYERGAFTGAHASACRQVRAGAGRHAAARRSHRDAARPAGEAAARAAGDAKSNASAAACPIALDVRVLATTNRNLRAEVAAGRFREDLYYRLNVFPLATAPLRERRDDVLPLAMQSARRRVAAPASAFPR